MTATKDQQYASVHNLVCRQAHAHARHTPPNSYNRDEIVAEAMYLYVKNAPKYDEAKSAYTTFVQMKVGFGLQTYAHKQAKKTKPVALAGDYTGRDYTRLPFDAEDLLTGLRSDAAEVVRLLLDSPGEMWEAVVTTKTGKHTPGGCRHRLAKVLEGRGWPLTTIKAAFKEITEALAS